MCLRLPLFVRTLLCCMRRPPWLSELVENPGKNEIGRLPQPENWNPNPKEKPEEGIDLWSTNLAVTMGMFLMLVMVGLIWTVTFFYSHMAVPAGFTRVGHSKLVYKKTAVIGTGSNGTMVYEGRLGTQNIAVKKMLNTHTRTHTHAHTYTHTHTHTHY